MGFPAGGFGGGVIGLTNATAGTVWYAVIPANPRAVTAVVGFSYTNGNTANSIYGMRPIGRANVVNAQTTSDSSVVLDADPSPSGNTIAAGDQCVIKYSDGTYRRTQVNTAGWNGTTKVLTFTAVLPAAVSAGAKFFMFGVFTDTDPLTGSAFPLFPTVASVSDAPSYRSFTAAGLRGAQAGDPLLIYCPNATAATLLNWTEYIFTIE